MTSERQVPERDATQRQAWATYWAGADDGACLPWAPPEMRAKLAAVWGNFAVSVPPGGAVLDIASGAGAVIKALHGARRDLAITGIDYAQVGPAAARLGVCGGIDADDLPFGDASFDAVTSQFGIEYCSDAAWRHSARVLKSGGRICFVCHHAESRLVAHNRARLAAMQALRSAGLFSLASDVARGRPEDKPSAAAVAAARARHAAQSIAEELPVALGLALRGPNARAAVEAIARRAAAEMARLQAMAAAALDADAVAKRQFQMRAAGIEILADILADEDGSAIAWTIANN